jgi:hypothetical protein
MREIGTEKYVSHIMNSHIKRTKEDYNKLEDRIYKKMNEFSIV